MNVITSYTIDAHIRDLQDEADQRRLQATARTSGARRGGRLAAIVDALRAAITGSDAGSGLPRLSDYPYRS